jgi:ABC-2 type transport system permease protein
MTTAVHGSRPPRAAGGQVPAHTGSRPFAGTGPLLLLALRQDRVMLPVWVLLLSLLVVSGAGTVESLYDTPQKRASLAASLSTNGSLRAMYGPVLDDSLGGLVAWRFGVTATVLAAVMSLLVVVRHTREEEETGRQELLSSAVVGRRAPLTAALLAALAGNTAVALLITAGLAGPTGSAAGGLALGLAVGGVGMLFAGTAAVMAQLTVSARLARGLTAAALGLAYALRAAGDAGSTDGGSVLTRLSPLGWAQQVRPYGAERWWVLALLAAAAVALGAVAYVLAGRRDVGMGFLPDRPGPARGRLATAGALARRLQRGSLAGWTGAYLLAGTAFGGMADGTAELVGENEETRRIFERMGGAAGLTDTFFAAVIGLFGMLAAVYAVAAVLRLHAEESSGRAEPVLATAVGRTRWAAGHLLFAFGGPVLLLTAAGAGLALGHGSRPAALTGAALAQLPAVWVLGAAALLLHAAVPAFARAAWGVAGLALAIGWIGPALDLPRRVLDLSPFGHLPRLPGEPMTWPPFLLLTTLAALLTAAGLMALARRDMRF